MTDTKVLIAGGGPAGLVLALELGTRGVDCILLNDAPHTASHPKANAVSSRTMEHMRRNGMSDHCAPGASHPIIRPISPISPA